MPVELEERVDRLGIVLEQFITQTTAQMAEVNAALLHMERNTERLERKTDRNIERLDASIERIDRTAERIDNTVKRMEQAAEKDRREHNTRWGDLANKMGTLVEDIIGPSLRRMAREELNCGEFESFTMRVERVHPVSKQQREFDAVAVGREAVIVNETKSTPRLDYAKEFVEFVKSGEFFEYFPEYKGRTVLPVFSSLHIPSNITEYLTKQKVYVVAMGDDAMQVVNLKELQPQKE